MFVHFFEQMSITFQLLELVALQFDFSFALTGPQLNTHREDFFVFAEFYKRLGTFATFEFAGTREIYDDSAVKNFIGKRFCSLVLIHRAAPKNIAFQRQFIRFDARVEVDKNFGHAVFWQRTTRFQLAQKVREVMFHVRQIHFVEQDNCHVVSVFFRALDQKSQHGLRVEFVVNRIEEAEHRLLRIPIRLDGHRDEIEAAERRIQARQFRFARAAHARQYRQRRPVRDFKRRVENA